MSRSRSVFWAGVTGSTANVARAFAISRTSSASAVLRCSCAAGCRALSGAFPVVLVLESLVQMSYSMR